MIFKAIVSAKRNNIDLSPYKKELFQIFGKGMLIESITHVEDTVRIIVTQIIAEFLEEYFEED